MNRVESGRTLFVEIERYDMLDKLGRLIIGVCYHSCPSFLILGSMVPVHSLSQPGLVKQSSANLFPVIVAFW